MDPFTLLRHPLLAFQNFRNKSQLIQYCNEHGYEQRFGHKLTYYRLTRYPNEVQQFLNELQEEMDFQRFASQVEVEAPTQRPHHERQEQYDTNNWMSTVEVQAPTQRPHSVRELEYNISGVLDTLFDEAQAKEIEELKQTFDQYMTSLDEAYRKQSEYVHNTSQRESEWINLEPTVSFQAKEDELNAIKEKLLTKTRELFSTMKTDTAYVFQYQLVDDQGNTDTRDIQLTQRNTKAVLELLENRGLLISDAEHFEAYEDEELKLPSWAIIKHFRILRYTDRYPHSKSPTDRYKPRKFTGERKKWSHRGGSFFRWFVSYKYPTELLRYLKRLQILTRKNTKKLLKDSCVVYALKQAKVPDSVLDRMRITRLAERFIKLSDLITLCDEFGIKVRVRDCEKQRAGKHQYETVASTDTGEYEVNLCYYKEHYFLDEETPFTLDNIRHALTDTDFSEHIGKTLVKVRGEDYWRIRKDRPKLSTYKLIEALFEQNAFDPYTYEEYMDVPQLDLKRELSEVELKYDKWHCCKNAAQLAQARWSKKEEDTSEVFFADTETDTGKTSITVNGIHTKAHRVYLVCYSNEDGTKTGYYEGADCCEKFLDTLPDKAVVVFHNLKYDLNFLAKYFTDVGKDIARGLTHMLWKGTYKGKTITLKDSAQLITMKLAAFPKMFHLETGPKEKMPYNYVDYDRYMNGVGEVVGCGKREEPCWGAKDYDEFRESLKAADAMLPDDRWDVKKYVRFYCEQDVRILREGFNKFRSSVNDQFKLDVAKIHSICSLAFQCIEKNVFRKNCRILATSGLPDTFIRQAITGGRCMTRRNQCWHTTIPLVDFDAVSLYPSAMSILRVPLGAPKPFQGAVPEDADYYVAYIRLKKVGIHRDFPLIRIEEDDKNIWTDDERCLNRCYYVDKRTLEDWVEFQHVEYEMIRGFYWNEGTTDILSDYIRSLFLRRKQLKKEKNPLEKVYKLILNSTYGKMIQKPYDTVKEIVPEDQADDYRNRNYNYLAPGDYQIAESNLHVFEKHKGIRKTFSFSLIGEMVLSHSKHLMNRVMCLAEDLGIAIFYQDTDSMHIVRDRLGELAEAFEKKYGFPLIGEDLCQFHSDFDSSKLENLCPNREVYAKESWFLAKKIYLDVLTCDGTDEVDYHIRFKGISPSAIAAVVKRHYDGDTPALYKDLYENPDKNITFNLAEGTTSFELDRTMQVFTRKEFNRTISIPTSVPRVEYSHQ